MDKKPLIVVSFCTVVMIVLASLTNVVGFQTIQSSNEKVTIKISYSTLRGIEQVEKEISLQDSQRLSTIMNGSDTEALAYELTKLGLVPSSINSEQLRELIGGEHGKWEFALRNKVLNSYLDSERLNGTKRNLFCTIQGDARDCIYFAALEMTTFAIGWIFAWLSIHLPTWFPSLFPLIPIYDDMGVLFFLGFGLLLFANWFSYFRISPIRAIPILLSTLEDGLKQQKANLSTLGLLGNWSMQNYGMDMLLIGFLGVWITINDHMNYPACYFKGFSMYTAAREYEKI